MQIGKVLLAGFIVLLPVSASTRCIEIPCVLEGRISNEKGEALCSACIELTYRFRSTVGAHEEKIVLYTDEKGHFDCRFKQTALEYFYWYGEPCFFDALVVSVSVSAKGYSSHHGVYRFQVDLGKFMRDQTTALPTPGATVSQEYHLEIPLITLQREVK